VGDVRRSRKAANGTSLSCDPAKGNVLPLTVLSVHVTACYDICSPINVDVTFALSERSLSATMRNRFMLA